MIGRKSAIHLNGLLYGLFFGSIFSALALIFPHSHPVLKCLIIGVFVVSFYFVGAWVSIREELNKKIPTPSHELRRRKKDFYAWLDSQGRR
jgi:hypothetical protein